MNLKGEICALISMEADTKVGFINAVYICNLASWVSLNKRFGG
jgi:hypothetical protein